MATEVLSNEDLLREILLRLPVKPLLRFKCVSKHWLALISEPRFCHLHTLHQYHASRPFPSALLVGNTDTNATSFRCPIIPLKSSDSDSNKASKVSNLISKPKPGPRRIGFRRIATIIADTWAAFSRNIRKTTRPRPRRRPQFKTLCIDSDLFTNFRYVKVPGMSITIMQSCNGLLLLEGEPLEKPPNKINPRCFVYNPTTNQFVAVNFPNPQFGYLVIVSHFLSFEPLRSPHYKVILISIRIRDLSKYSLRDYVVNVYSSETGSWSDPGVCFTVPENSKAVYCNGALYWYSKNIVNSMYFDVQDNCFKTFPTPLGTNNKSVTYFGESGGHLHLIAHSWMEFEFDILELIEDRSGWSVRFHVNLHPMIDYCSDLGKFDLLSVAEMIHCDICCVVRQENEVGSMLVFSKYGKFIAYNLVDSTFRELGSFSSFFRSWRCDVFQYYENLSWVSPSNGY